MPLPDGSHALDHIVVVLFENRSLDNPTPPTCHDVDTLRYFSPMISRHSMGVKWGESTPR
jgi:hypothetical protein